MSVESGPIGDVATFLEVDASSLDGIPEHIIARVARKAQDAELLRSSKTMADLQAEQAVHDLNKKIELLEKALEDSKDVATALKTEDRAAEETRQKLEQDLLKLTQSTGSLEEEVSTLRQQQHLQQQDRHAILQSLDQRNIENRDLRKQLGEVFEERSQLRQKVHDLDGQVLKLTSEITHAKSREDTLRLELERSESDRKWAYDDLKRTQDASARTRNASLEQSLKLQSDFETLEATYKGLRKSHDALKETYSQLSFKHDKAISNVERLQRTHASDEESFQVELTALRRSLELAESNAQSFQTTANNFENELTATRSELGEKIEELGKLLENEQALTTKLRADLDSAEEKLSGLFDPADGVVGAGANASLLSLPGIQQDASFANLSQLPTNTPVRGILSPSAKVLSELHRKGGSVVDLLNSYNATKLDAERWKHKHDMLRRDMDRVLQELELNAPNLAREREEYDRIAQELATLSEQYDREAVKLAEAEKKNRQLETRNKEFRVELDLAGQQIQDLSRQVQNLLINSQLSEDGEPALTAKEKETIANLLSQRNESEGDTDRLISERMTLFLDIAELQQQNEQLLKVCRSLGRRMEDEEQKNKDKLANAESEALAEATKTLELLQAKLSSVNTQLESVKHERDMFRRIASKDNNNSTVNGGDVSFESSFIAREKDVLSGKLEETTAAFSTYKLETKELLAANNDHIKELEHTSRDLHTQLARAKAQLELVTERKNNVDEELRFVKIEYSEASARIASMQEALSKQTQRTDLFHQEVVEAKSMSETFRNQFARIEAEKELWKTQEQRLINENAQLLEDATRFKSLVQNMQSREVERETARSESEKRLLQQIETLQVQVTSTNRKLESTEDEMKQIYNRREVENTSHQEKLAELGETLSSLRQSLSLANASKEPLELKVNELKVRLEAAEERAALHTAPVSFDSGISSDNMGPELVLARKELKIAQDQISQLTQMAKASEEALENMNASHSEYSQSMSESIEAKEQIIADLRGELESMRSEIDLLRQKQLENQTEELKQTIEDLKHSEEQLRASYNQVKSEYDVQASTLVTTKAKYEQELSARTEANQKVEESQAREQELRDVINDLTFKHKSVLDQLETVTSTFESQRDAYDAEIEQLHTRANELASQNKLILDQLEAATKPRNNVQIDPNDSSVSMADESLSNDENMLISYLRRQKEMSDLNLQVAQQEVRRLNQRLEHITASLASTSAELERLKANHESQLKAVQATAGNDELITALKETNSSLRSQYQHYAEKAQTLEAQLSQSRATFEPVESKLRDALAESEARAEQIKLLEEDNSQWKHRLQQYVQNGNSSEELKAVQAELKVKEETLKSLRNEAQEKLRKGATERRNLQEEVSRLNTQVNELSAEIERRKTELAEARASSDVDQTPAAPFVTAAPVNDQDTSELESQLALLKSELQEKNERIDYLENEVNRVSDELVEVQEKGQLAQSANIQAAQVDAELRAELETLRSQIAQLEQLKTAATDAEEIKSQLSALQTAKATSDNEVDQLRAKLTEAEKTIEDLRSSLSSDFASIEIPVKLDSDPELESLTADLKEKVGADAIDSLAAKMSAATQERIKAKSHEFVRSRVENLTASQKLEIAKLQQQLKEAQSKAPEKSVKEIEASMEKKFDLKQKLLRKRVEQLEATNNELSLTVRKLKGGIDVAITTLPSGVTKVVEQKETAKPASNSEPKNENKRDPGNRPAVNRQGKGGGFKRPNQDNQSQMKKRKEN